ncbi:extracellular solute-binding protein [Rubrimonas sp.]|uniref:extracellular solute-binding protein n=1 Tax=Rubrimonas sp. TaxID=2036015 RepID=UPI002FDE7716
MTPTKLGFTITIAAAMLGGDATAQTEIRMWFGLGGRLQEEVLAQCERFNAAQDEVNLVCSREGTYDEIFNQAMAAVRAGNQPHILQVVDRGTGTMMLSGAAIPAYELVDRLGIDVNWDDYFDAIGNYYADREGNLWAFPFNSSTAMVYYNTGALEAAGYDAFPRTWEEFDALLYALRDEAGYDCSLAWTIDLWSDLEQFSAIHDIPVATRNNGYEGLDAELVVNQTRVVQHFEMQQRWFDDGILEYNPDFEVRRDLFVNGTCPIFFNSIAGFTSTQALAEASGIEWTVAELPHYADVTPINNLVGGAALWTMAGFSDEEYEAIGRFYAFLAQPDQQIAWSDGTGYFPVTESAYRSLVDSGYYQEPDNINRDLAVRSLLRAEPTVNSMGIRLGNYVEIRNILTEEIQQALTGTQTMQQAFDEGVRRGNELLRRFEATYPGTELP